MREATWTLTGRPAVCTAGSALRRLFGLRASIRGAHEAACAQQLEERLAAFEQTRYLAASTKERIRPQVADSLRQVVAYEAWEPLMEDFVAVARVGASYCGLAAALGATLTLFTAHRSVGTWGLAALIAVLVFVLARGAVEFTQWWWPILPRWPMGTWPVLLLFGFGLALRSLWAGDLDWLPRLIRDGLGAGLAGGVVFLALFLVVAWSSWAVCVALARRLKLHRHPEAELIEALRWAFVCVADPKAPWGRLEYQRQVDWGLEWIARRLEQGRPRSHDPETDAWLRTGAREMAADIRRLKQSALLPRAGSRRELAQALGARLVLAAEGRWGHFARSTPPAGPSRLVRLAQPLYTIRPFLAAAVPLLVAGLVGFSPLAEPIKQPIVQLSLGLSAVTVLSWLNPDYGQRIASVNSLLGDFLRPRKG
jgi:hypothetical protein